MEQFGQLQDLENNSEIGGQIKKKKIRHEQQILYCFVLFIAEILVALSVCVYIYI